MKKIGNLVLAAAILFAALGAISADNPPAVPVVKGIAVVGDEKVPVFPGVTEISATVGDDKSISISYDVVKSTESKVARFYTGKRVFGMKVPRFKDAKNGPPTAVACKKGKGVQISLDSSAKPDTVMVSISNICSP